MNRRDYAGKRGAYALYDPPLACAGCGQDLLNDGSSHVVLAGGDRNDHALFHPACCPCHVRP